MINTRILVDQEPLENILEGARTLYKAVSTTMGPRGSNVIIKKAGGRAFVTHDGVTVAKAVKIKDAAQDVSADLLREAASKLDTTTGDGTTTVTVLAYHLLEEAAKLVAQGHNPMKVNLELQKLEPIALDTIKAHSTDVTTAEQLQAVARVSSGSQEIGDAVGKAVFEAGKDTPIILGFSGSTETLTEVIKGIRIESGAASPYLLDEGIKSDLERPRIIVCDAKLRDKEDVLPILKALSVMYNANSEELHQVLFVVSDIAGDALSMLVMNRLKGFSNIAVARVPEHIKNHTDYLSDVALATGATVLSRNTGNTIREPRPEHFGSADQVISKLDETVIVNGHFAQEDLDSRVAMLEETAATAKEKSVREFAQMRLKVLGQSIVSIHVGGQSESEADEKHYRYEDAIGACQSALRQGTVPGGGTLLYFIGKNLMLGTPAGIAFGDALMAPLTKVLDNAGAAIPDGIEPGLGIDVMHPEDGLVNLVERGVIDPTESELECVKTAVSIAGLLLTSGGMIVDEVEEAPRAETQL